MSEKEKKVLDGDDKIEEDNKSPSIDNDDDLDDEESDDVDFDDEEDEEDEDTNESQVVRQTYVPGANDNPDEELEYEESAYVLYQKAETGFPCLSFDIIPDDLGTGEDRANSYPMTFTMVSGTQGSKANENFLLVIKISNLHKNKEKNENDSDSDSDEDEDDEGGNERQPEFVCTQIPHKGCINRVRSTLIGNKILTGSWSELGTVNIWDLSKPIQACNEEQSMKQFNKEKSFQPIYTFSGHQQEGYAMDWNQHNKGQLLTGDCSKNIHLWNPSQNLSSWNVNQQPLLGHTDSVEDIQWSPNESNIFTSCSVDKTIRIWDIRLKTNEANVLTVFDAHDLDVNVISWNRKDNKFLLSGGDDGAIKTWDLRQLLTKKKESKPLATFKHHTKSITSIEWHPVDSTVFAASGSDNQLTLWDLAVEADDDEDEQMEPEVAKLPPQLLFIHQGQKDIKELHWHQQIPGLIISTASNGLDIFRSICV